MAWGFSFLTSNDWARIEAIVKKYALQTQGKIMTAEQDIINAVTTELSNLGPTLSTLLTEVQQLVAGNPNVDTSALTAAADAVASQVNAVAAAAQAGPVVTPPSP
jgi:hypothetical protein